MQLMTIKCHVLDKQKAGLQVALTETRSINLTSISVGLISLQRLRKQPKYRFHLFSRHNKPHSELLKCLVFFFFHLQ